MIKNIFALRSQGSRWHSVHGDPLGSRFPRMVISGLYAAKGNVPRSMLASIASAFYALDITFRVIVSRGAGCRKEQRHRWGTDLAILGVLSFLMYQSM